MPFGTKTDRDLEQYRNRVGHVLKKNLRSILKNDPIITDRKARVRVPDDLTRLPVPGSREGMDRPLDRWIWRDADRASRPGDVVDRVPRPGAGRNGRKAGSEEGQHFIDVWLDEGDLLDMIMEEWKLPRWKPRPLGNSEVPVEEWSRRGTVGPPTRLLRRRTLREMIKHGAPIRNADLRYRQVEIVPQPQTEAVVFLLRDVSGSMMSDQVTQWIRAMAFVLAMWLRSQYDRVQIEFVTYDMRAERETEERWFGKDASGGTRLSKALDLVSDLIATEYPTDRWQLYQYLWTDGADWRADEVYDWLEKEGERFNQLGWILLQEPDAMGSLFQPSQSPVGQAAERWQAAHPGSPLEVVPFTGDGDMAQVFQQFLGAKAAVGGVG